MSEYPFEFNSGRKFIDKTDNSVVKLLYMDTTSQPVLVCQTETGETRRYRKLNYTLKLRDYEEGEESKDAYRGLG